jgi:hypothetical protein
MSNYPPQPPFPPQQPQKKKTSPIVWILAGCGSLVLVGVVVAVLAGLFVWQKAKDAGLDPDLMERNPALAAAKMAVAVNPEVELVSVDEKKGTITIKEKKTGKTVTVTFEDAAEGKMTFKATDEKGEEAEMTVEASREGSSGSMEFKSKEGTVRIGEGASAAAVPSWLPSYPGSSPQATFSAESDSGKTQNYHFITSDSVDQVLRFYREQLEDAGFRVNMSTVTQNSRVSGGTVTAEDDGKRRTVLVSVIVSQQGTQVTVSAQSKTSP